MTNQSRNQISSFIAKDLSMIKKEFQTRFPPSTINQWQPKLYRSLLSIVVDWVAIFLSVAATFFVSKYFLPLSLVIIGSRQRALSNIVHDAAHFNLIRKKRVNDIISDLFAAFSMFDTTKVYRNSHIPHHTNLGVEGVDPDLSSHQRYGFDDHAPPCGQAGKTYKALVLNRSSWFDSGIGNLMKLSTKDKIKVSMWWVACLSVIALGLGLKFAILFVALWILSRLTTYHLIRIFAEFLDHTGLKPGSILGFSRTIPKAGFLGNIFHPHADHYHLVHHLMPGVPHYKLKSAHEMLTLVPQYSGAHHCTGYFSGSHSAIACWAGICDGGGQ